MPAISVRKLDTCTEEDLDNIAKVFTVAFRGDPVALAMTGGDESESLLYALERATVACVAISGQLWVASYGDQDFVSAATWLPPGRVLLDTPDQQAIFGSFLDSLQPELKRWWLDTFLPQYEAATDEVLGEGGKEKAWNLMTIGTLPDARRRGLASALVQAVIKKAEANDEPLTVETGNKDNLTFYERQGWKTLNEDKPGHFDDMHGRPLPIWVISSTSDS
ncbi:unnamed protein product [Peniophora sp. CBMAI 1063]|nr:unnamed protein product [Peniophora sp. CBMAI 1063]